MGKATDQVQPTAASHCAEAARQKSDARYLHLLNSNLFGVGIGDFEGNCIDANDALLNMLGYGRADLKSGRMKWPDFIPPEWRRTSELALSEVQATGICVPYESVLVRKDGSRVPTLIHITLAPDDPAYHVVSVIDLTKQKQVEQELRASEARARLLIDNNEELGFFMLDPGGNVTSWNAGAERLTGYRPEETIGKHFSIFYPPEDVADGKPPRLLQQASQGRAEDEDWRVRKDGTRFWAEVILIGIRDDANALLGFANITKDITERRRADVLLTSTLNKVSDGIIGIDEQGKIESINAAAEKMFGYQAAEVLGQNVNILMPEPYHSEHDDYLTNYLRTGEARIIGIGRQVDVRRKDGTTFPVDLAVSEFMLYGRRHFVGAMRDITVQRKLEEQLRQAQKMEVIGRLAGGVAHDFNNMMTIILGYSELLQDTAPDDDQWRIYVEAINESGQRAAGLTRQLLAFGRQTVLEPKLLDLNDIVDETEKMLRRFIGEDILLTTTLDPALCRVLVDPGQIGQVLMNLTINARDAMPQGGQLTIETSNVELDAAYVRMHPDARTGPCVKLTISDTGCGMPPEVKARIFEPFFTTKASGVGTGLGLATVYGIVKQSGGHVDVYSEPGVGTAFKILLPAVGAPAMTEDQPTATPRAGSGHETILLVEDDERVRKMALLTLQNNGYKVLEASHGSEAVEIAKRPHGAIDLLLTDVVMPGMSGRQLVAALDSLLPDAKVLFMSGYTDDAVIRHGILQADVAFLQKPFTPTVLARKVREVLDGKAPLVAAAAALSEISIPASTSQ